MEYIYQSGWGAFAVMLLFQIPFLVVFLWVIMRKSGKGAGPSNTSTATVSRLKAGWLTLAIAMFLVVNLASIRFIPAIYSARAATSGVEPIDVKVEAQSWNYDMSAQEFVAGQPVRFNVKSLDTVHGFAVYHPDGHILFTMMLVPGVRESSLTYTFRDPGTYTVRCLEYCGMAHHEMNDEITVTAAATAS